jgi:demethylmenaquinone methyltransferase/2-methoxy-6-polyprenyl-1,4-benzoquinol methylase
MKPDETASSSDKTTHFGFQTVREEEKETLVRAVFDGVAPSYDLMNDLMSGGVHRLWKAAMIGKLRPRADMRLLDLGGGTGDIAFRFKAKGGGPVTVCDINKEMLSVGRDRALDRSILDGIDWVCGDAEKLPFPDRSTDAVTMSQKRDPYRSSLGRSAPDLKAGRAIPLPGIFPGGDPRPEGPL